jgi:hypothetical protein
VEKYGCSYHALLVDQQTGRNVIDLALAMQNPESALQLLELSIHTKLGLDINHIDSLTQQTYIVRLWTLLSHNGAQMTFINRLIKLGARLFEPCPWHPHGVASCAPSGAYSGFINDYIASNRTPPWPFSRGDDAVAVYLESALYAERQILLYYLLDNVLEVGQFTRLVNRVAQFKLALTNLVFSYSLHSDYALKVLSALLKHCHTTGVPFPSSLLPNAIAAFTSWGPPRTLQLLSMVLPTMDRTYDKSVHEYVIEQRHLLSIMCDDYINRRPQDPIPQEERCAYVDRIYTLLAFMYDLSSCKEDPECGALKILPSFWSKLAGIDLISEQQILSELNDVSE